jgi:regulatory protein
VDQIYLAALKLLRNRDHTVSSLRQKLEGKFGVVPEDVIEQLLKRNFLNDRRFAVNYVSRRKDRSPSALREDLIARGVAVDIVDETLSQVDSPSLREAMAAKIEDWKLRTPLQPRDVARLFRALLRLGYDEDAIREEMENS